MLPDLVDVRRRTWCEISIVPACKERRNREGGTVDGKHVKLCNLFMGPATGCSERRHREGYCVYANEIDGF